MVDKIEHICREITSIGFNITTLLIILMFLVKVLIKTYRWFFVEDLETEYEEIEENGTDND